jgi:transcriptional regulator with XRE-family HTH domain
MVSVQTPTEQSEITFGSWLRQLRVQRQLTLQDLAQDTITDVGTISRIERGNTQPTLITVVRLCAILRISPDELLTLLARPEHRYCGVIEPQALFEKFFHLDIPMPHHRSNQNIQKSSCQQAITEINVLRPADVMQFVERYTEDATALRPALANMFNFVMTSLGEETDSSSNTDSRLSFSEHDIDKLTVMMQYFTWMVPLPKMSIETLVTIHQHGGAVIAEDIEIALNDIHKNLATVRLQLNATEQHTSIEKYLDKSTERLSTTTLDRIRLDTVLELDEVLGENGGLLKAYWYVCLLYLEVNGFPPSPMWRAVRAWSEPQRRLAAFLVALCRWSQHFGHYDFRWVREVADPDV